MPEMKYTITATIGVSFAILACLLTLDGRRMERRVSAADFRKAPLIQNEHTRPRAASPGPVSPPNNSDVERRVSARDDLLRALSSNDETLRYSAIKQQLQEFSSANPAEAASLIEAMPDTPERDSMLKVVAEQWTDSDRQAVLAWADALVEERDRETVRYAVLSRISQTNPDQAVQLAQQQIELGAKNIELEALAQRWAEQDLSAFRAWADSLPPGEQHDLIVARAAFVIAQAAPAEAARWITDQTTQGITQTEALISILHQWAQQDPEGASAWVGQLPGGHLRDRADRELVAMARARIS